ncbi:MAG: tRNA1(Val) (adenine(37)-N6)-methyltransferase [Syntrophotaleaceae bacterium]
MTGENGLIRPGETLDELLPGGWRIIQKRDGYRFSLDPVLLCAFAAIGSTDKICDLGTGSGVIPLLLAGANPAATILGIEVQPDLADRARRNVELNGLRERVTILEVDLRRIREALPAESCRAVLANPPYRRPATGRMSPHSERALARHEVQGGLIDFVDAAAWLLPTGGRFFLVYLAERMAELLAIMRQGALEPKRLRCIHSRFGEEARMVLVEGRKGSGPGLKVEPPLYVYEGEDYSLEIKAIYGR